MLGGAVDVNKGGCKCDNKPSDSDPSENGITPKNSVKYPLKAGA